VHAARQLASREIEASWYRARENDAQLDERRALLA
jgi:hypothetical protein